MVLPGGRWWVLVASGGPWLLLVAPGGSWWLLVAPGGHVGCTTFVFRVRRRQGADKQLWSRENPSEESPKLPNGLVFGDPRAWAGPSVVEILS